MNLLIVDDDIPTTEVLRSMIDRNALGIDEIYTAFQVDMAKRVFTERQVDLILCDIEMPRENGLSFLEWVRQNEACKTEFIFLTCFEKFEYAKGALEYEASNYLLKPINMVQVNKALEKSVGKIKQRRQAEIYQELGEYWAVGQTKLIRDFWNNVVWGYVQADQKSIEKQIHDSHLGIQSNASYSMLYLRIDKQRVFEKDTSKAFCRFLLENSVSQTLEGKEAMENLTIFEDETDFYLGAFLTMDPEQILAMIQPLSRFLVEYYGADGYTGYVSERVSIGEISKIRQEMQLYDRNNIVDRGKIIRFSKRVGDDRLVGNILDQGKLLEYLESGARASAMSYVESCCRQLGRGEKQSIHELRTMQGELLQGIHVFLYRRGIDAGFLINDRMFLEMQKKAVYSAFNMMKWCVYGLNKALDSSNELLKKETLAEKMRGYLDQHYMEDITRNDVAEQLGLTAEYAGKLFKREMGINIQDYINRLRIEKAAFLLKETDQKVIDIAMTVGFNNIPYFTTLFKKHKGMTPREFQKNNI